MSDPCFHDTYSRLHDSPLQRKFRRIRPWPVGVVFVQHPGMTLEDIREQFKLMKHLGFTCLKQCELLPGMDRRQVLNLALDEGIIPWWYDDGGWEDPTPDLLAELGIDPEIEPQDLRQHPGWLERQDRLARERIDRATGSTSMPAGEAEGLPGTLPRFQYELPAEAAGRFVSWLQDRYGTLDGLKEAWNFHHALVTRRDWQTWDDVRKDVVELVNREKQEYRRIADVLRFKADVHLEYVRAKRDRALAEDRHAPVRAGGEMSLFLPFAYRATDMEGIADLMTDGGSFYPSIHPSWHFEEMDFEFLRPIYMQASLAVDWFKGGWAASWESTGGPQQLSGGKGHFVNTARSTVAGFTIDGPAMEQLMLSWIAAGFKGFGQWCWNGRSFGWEAGEYALLDRNGAPCDRTFTAGNIGAACQRLRDELWEARKEPLVGVFQDWEMESIWAAVSMGGRDFYRSYPMYARCGISRALINANIPWEHVTARDLRAGLADRYRVIYLPACLALDTALLEIFRGFVFNGGRLVMDAPGGWYDYGGRLLDTRSGSLFEELFGCRIGDFQFSRRNSREWRLQERFVPGFVLELQPTRAVVQETFDGGLPAVVEHSLGAGQAVILGYEASLLCAHTEDPAVSPHPFVPRLVPDRASLWHEQRLGWLAPGPHRSPYACDQAIVYRLAAPAADHYFLLNDGPARDVILDLRDFWYNNVEDAITGERLSLAEPIPVRGHGGRWLRCQKYR